MKIRYNRSVKASSGDKDYADLRGMDFKKARDILTKDGFSEHEYGDKDDNNGYAVYRKGNKEVELQYRWNPGKRKNEYHAGKVTNVYVDDDINASCGKKSVKAARYSDAVPYEDRRYWYFTTHGIGPGMLPKGVNILDTQEGQNRKGTWGDYILLDAVLNTDELREYDLVELAPKSIEDERFAKSRSESNWDNYIFLDDVESSCSKKSVKSASGSIKNKSRNVQVYFWQNNAYNAVVFTDGEYWIVFDGGSNGKFDGSVDLYDEDAVSELKSYIKNADFNSFDEMYNEFSQDQGSMSPAVGDNFGREFDKNELTKVGTIYEGKAEASTGNRHYSKIMAGAGAGYTIKWTLEKIRKVNSFDVVDASLIDSYGTVVVTADCDVELDVTIDSAWSYMYGFNEPIEGVSAKLSRIIFDFNVLDDTSLNPDDYEDGLQDKEFQDEVYNYVYQFNEMDAFDLLEYDAYEEIKSGEYNFGTGYSHTTWDGTIDEIDGDYNFADIKVTDQEVINYVDKAVLGDADYTYYQIVDHETEDVIDGGYETLEEAEGVANDLVSNGAYAAIEIYRVSEKEKHNGDIDLIDDEYIEMIEF